MSCNDNRPQFHVNCVCDVVKFIEEIQSAQDGFGCATNCLNPVLGGTHHGPRPNTRVFSLFTKEGEPFKAFFLDHHCDVEWSKFFRAESVEDCCAVLRVLKLDHDDSMAPCTFKATNQCIIVDLNCFCGIACIEDTFVSGL